MITEFPLSPVKPQKWPPQFLPWEPLTRWYCSIPHYFISCTVSLSMCKVTQAVSFPPFLDDVKFGSVSCSWAWTTGAPAVWSRARFSWAKASRSWIWDLQPKGIPGKRIASNCSTKIFSHSEMFGSHAHNLTNCSDQYDPKSQTIEVAGSQPQHWSVGHCLKLQGVTWNQLDSSEGWMQLKQ